jgi:two-component system CheB/CheR fusion protein
MFYEFIAREEAAAIVENREPMQRGGLDVRLKFNAIEAADRIILDRFAPAGVIINGDLEIIQIRGRTGAYLEPAAGEPSLKLFKMVRESLSLGLRSAINQAKQENISVTKEGVQVIYMGGSNHVDDELTSFGGMHHKEEYFLILFEKVVPGIVSEDKKISNTATNWKRAGDSNASSELIGLEHELIALRENLQSVIEQYELTNEKLRAANEEIQSSNEELQSMNEELETAKEELQSSNEELMTLNDEVQSRNQELSKSGSDLFNLFRSINIPVVMVSSNLHIRSFNPVAEKVLNLIATDVGRPITDINTKFNNYDLEQAILDVLDTLISKEEEIQDRYGHWYSVQIRPYRTLENRIDGVVIAYMDIDAGKINYALSQEAREYAEAIVETVRHPLVVLDANLHVKSANQAFYRVFMVSQNDTIDKSIFDLGNGQWEIPELHVLLEEMLVQRTMLEGYEVVHDFPHIGHKRMLVNARRIVSANSPINLILMAIEDITKLPPSHEHATAY